MHTKSRPDPVQSDSLLSRVNVALVKGGPILPFRLILQFHGYYVTFVLHANLGKL